MRKFSFPDEPFEHQISGRDLKVRRQSLGMTQKQVADKIGCNPSAISFWENSGQFHRRQLTRGQFTNGRGVLRALMIYYGGKHLLPKRRIGGHAGVDIPQLRQDHWNQRTTAQFDAKEAYKEIYEEKQKRKDTSSSNEVALRTCGAKTRSGSACRRKVLYSNGRCANHGGLSTGPKSKAGRARIAAAQRKRWAKGSPSSN